MGALKSQQGTISLLLNTKMGKVKAALGGCAAYEVAKHTKEHHNKKKKRH